MGTILKRTDNLGKATYQAKIRRVGFPALSKTFPTKAAAEAWLAQTEGILNPTEANDERTALKFTLGELLRRYGDEVSPTKKGGDLEVIRIKALCRKRIAKFAVGNLTTQVFAAFRDDRLKEVTGSTVNREFNLIHHVLEIARKEWRIGTGPNPLSDVRRPKSSPGRIRRLSASDERDLLRACSESRGGFLRTVVELALETGMRQGEIISLEWRHVDRVNRRALLPDTKNNTSRGVPLTRRAIELIEARPGRHGRVFEGVTAEAVKRAFIRASQRANLSDFHFHDLRHEATSRFFEKGLSMMEVASITGHKSVAMLQRYTHLHASGLADKLDAVAGHSTL